jgi:protein gp37
MLEWYHETNVLGGGDYLKNVWFGISAENQARADERISKVLQIPAAKHFISLEPLLGPINISEGLPPIDWVIVGAETGAGARPCDPDWVRSIRDQCRVAGVPLWVKSLGKQPIPDDLMIRERP